MSTVLGALTRGNVDSLGMNGTDSSLEEPEIVAVVRQGNLSTLETYLLPHNAISPQDRGQAVIRSR